jgi:CRP-like cAMP-binding protein
MVFFELFSHNPDIVVIKAGASLFAEGDAGHQMFVLIAGTAEVVVAQRVLETLEHGSIVGEMDLVAPGRRSASVVARTDCQFVAIDEPRFRYLVQQTPHFAMQVLRVLAERLRATDQLVLSRKRA